MDSLVSLLQQHGTSILCAAVFLETIGFPVPAAIALLLAGGASANGTLHGPTVIGAALYIGAYWSLGFLFAGAITAMVGGMQAFGLVIEWLLIAAVVAYLGYLGWAWIKAGRLRAIPRAPPAEVARAITDRGAAI